LEQALSSCANTEASATAIAANESTSVEDDIDFFNFIKSSPTPLSHAHLVFLDENRTELPNVGQTSRNQTTFRHLFTNQCFCREAVQYSFFGTKKYRNRLDDKLFETWQR